MQNCSDCVCMQYCIDCVDVCNSPPLSMAFAPRFQLSVLDGGLEIFHGKSQK